jgi:hypothetical protein
LGARGAAALTIALVCTAEAVHAQCATCATPTVAYSPVVAATPVVTYEPYTGWYPGRFFDRLRLRRWGVTAAAAPAYTAAYAPATYTTAYAPSYTASYTPYVTAYAPLQQPVAVQSSYLPATTVAYAPTTLYRPALLTPTVTMQPVVAEPACSACAVEAPCAAGAAYVDQASYALPASGCSACEVESAAPMYSDPYGGIPVEGGVSGEPPTPTPALKPATPEPGESGYLGNGNGTALDPHPEDEVNGTNTSFDLEAPPLIGPLNDRTANRPTVDVRTAIYRRPAPASSIGASTLRSAAKQPTQAEIDAEGWAASPAG